MVGDLVSKADQTKWFSDETDAFHDRWYRIYSWWMCKSFDLDEKIGFKIWKVPAKEDIVEEWKIGLDIGKEEFAFGGAFVLSVILMLPNYILVKFVMDIAVVAVHFMNGLFTH